MLSCLLLLLVAAAEIPETKNLADLPKPSAIVPLKLDSEVIRIKTEAQSPPRHRVLCDIGLSEELLNKRTPPQDNQLTPTRFDRSGMSVRRPLDKQPGSRYAILASGLKVGEGRDLTFVQYLEQAKVGVAVKIVAKSNAVECDIRPVFAVRGGQS